MDNSEYKAVYFLVGFFLALSLVWVLSFNMHKDADEMMLKHGYKVYCKAENGTSAPELTWDHLCPSERKV